MTERPATSQLIHYRDLVSAVKLSRGWYRRIARESGCRVATLRNMANSPSYDPLISEIELLRAWYWANGIPQAHPNSSLGRSMETTPTAA